MYFALRLSITLDETFAYYDEERLKNTIEYLNENYKDYQILMLTCSTREKQALEELKIPYNEITL